MAAFLIELTEEAKEDLLYFAASQRKALISEIRTQLSHQPLVATRNRKPLRLNPIAPWELRIGRYRVFYEVDESSRVVSVTAVGEKEHNQLFIRGNEVRL